MDEWKDISSAPRDGSQIQARIPGYGDENYISWTDGLLSEKEEECGGWCFEYVPDAPDCWTDGICWEVNADEKKSVHPTFWRLPPPPQAKEDE